MRSHASLVAALLASSLLTVASCGSKTGLFTPDRAELLPDGGPAIELDGQVPCIPGTFGFELATAQIMFVLDRSGSMNFSLAGVDPRPPGVASRWEVLRDALATTIVPFDDQIAMGAKFFPEPLSEADLASSAQSCRTDVGVGLPPARGNATAILSVFGSTEPRGGTPTAEAIRIAAQYLAERRSVARTLVVATDGAPNCNAELNAQTCTCTTPRLDCARVPNRGRYSCLDDKRTIDAIADVANTRRIPVYVIGIGSTERADFLHVLDEMAVAGGRPRPTVPRHYNAQSPGELTAALETIRESATKCTYLTPSSPIDPNAIAVEIAGISVLRDPTHESGWDWVDQAYGELELFGDACDRAQRGAPPVTGVVTCEPR